MRTRSIDLVTDGRLTRRVLGAWSAPTLRTLDRVLPDGWLSVTGGRADLAAAVLLTPGVTLNLGADLPTVRLHGGPRPADAATISTGGGRLVLRGVTVGSLDPRTGAALPLGPGRPFVAVSAGGGIESTDSTLTDLGTGTDDAGGRAGLSLGAGSTGALTRTSLLRNSVGLELDRTDRVRLDGVTTAESAADGLVLRGDVGTTMSVVRSERNGGNGVLVKGPGTDRLVTGIGTAANRLFGVAAVGQHDLRIAGVDTSGDAVGGLRLSNSSRVTVDGFTARGTPIGIYTHVSSSRLTLRGVRVVGARRGVQVEKTTRGLTLDGASINGASIAGIAVGGHEVTLRDTAVHNSATGVRIERGAGEVTADGVRLSGGTDGIVALSATTGVVVRNLTAQGVDRAAVRTASAGLRVEGGRITGGSTGIDALSATAISGTMISDVEEGVRARFGAAVRIADVDVSALNTGVNAAAGSPVQLVGSRLDALQAVRGDVRLDGSNTLSLPPLNLLGAIGVPLVLLALILEQVRTFRQRSFDGLRRRLPPRRPADVI